MTPPIYPICDLGQGRLFIMPKPDAEVLTQAMRFYRQQGIHKIISCLKPEEISHLKLENEAEACAEAGIAFEHFPVQDMDVPQLSALQALHQRLKAELAEGVNISIHCHGGRGRAGTVAVSLMIEHGYCAEEAMALASEARGDKVPVCEVQVDFLKQYQPA